MNESDKVQALSNKCSEYGVVKLDENYVKFKEQFRHIVVEKEETQNPMICFKGSIIYLSNKSNLY